MTRNRRGAYLIEFALVLPVVLAALGGVVEYGRYLERQMTVVSVMRDAARTGTMQLPILGAPPAEAARTTAEKGLAEQGLHGVVTASVEGVAPDKVLRVTAKVPYTPILGLVPAPDDFDYTVVMRLQTQL